MSCWRRRLPHGAPVEQLTKTGCLAGVGGLELRNPCASHVFEKTLQLAAARPKPGHQRLFAFELRCRGYAARALAPGSQQALFVLIRPKSKPWHETALGSDNPSSRKRSRCALSLF